MPKNKSTETKQFIICISGERKKDTKFKETINNLLSVHSPTKCIFGDCKGVDTMAKEVCDELNIPYEIYPANWGLYGKGAGPRRNKQMIDTKPDLVLAFHSDISISLGTKNLIKYAKSQGVPVEFYGE